MEIGCHRGQELSMAEAFVRGDKRTAAKKGLIAMRSRGRIPHFSHIKLGAKASFCGKIASKAPGLASS